MMEKGTTDKNKATGGGIWQPMRKRQLMGKKATDGRKDN